MPTAMLWILGGLGVATVYVVAMLIWAVLLIQRRRDERQAAERLTATRGRHRYHPPDK
jgi:hypothetical protein